MSEPFPASGAASNASGKPGATPLSAPERSLAGSRATAAATPSRETSRAPLATADWIALIRRLRAEGRIDEAARELAAFRAAHPDHARELPPDLRDWRAADPATAAPAPR